MEILTNNQLSRIRIDTPSIPNNLAKFSYTAEDVHQICHLFTEQQLTGIDREHLQNAFDDFWEGLENYVNKRLITSDQPVVITLFRHTAILQLSASSFCREYPSSISAVSVDWNTGTVVSFHDGCQINQTVYDISCTLHDDTPMFVLSPEFTRGDHLKFKEFIKRTLFHVSVASADPHAIVHFDANPLQCKAPELYRALIYSLTKDEQFRSNTVWTMADVEMRWKIKIL